MRVPRGRRPFCVPCRDQGRRTDAVAYCDTRAGDGSAFRTCGVPMCEDHVGAEPIPGFHRCEFHARERGEAAHPSGGTPAQRDDEGTR